MQAPQERQKATNLVPTYEGPVAEVPPHWKKKVGKGEGEGGLKDMCPKMVHTEHGPPAPNEGRGAGHSAFRVGQKMCQAGQGGCTNSSLFLFLFVPAARALAVLQQAQVRGNKKPSQQPASRSAPRPPTRSGKLMSRAGTRSHRHG